MTTQLTNFSALLRYVPEYKHFLQTPNIKTLIQDACDSDNPDARNAGYTCKEILDKM